MLGEQVHVVSCQLITRLQVGGEMTVGILY